MALPLSRQDEAVELAGAARIDDRARRSERGRALHRFLRYRPGVVGGIFVIALILVALFAPVVAPYSPTEKVGVRADPPTSEFLMGNDEIGRDVFSRLLYGTRVALVVGIGAIAIAVAIGVTVGATSGYFGGIVDTVLSRVVDTLMAFPLLALLVTLSALFAPSLRNVVIVIGVTVWASYARVVRADVMSLREREFVVAARSIGAGDRRIIGRHILPNIVGPVIVLASLDIGSIIILESALSFLGLGVQPPTPSWGGMLSAGRSLLRNAPHIAVAPGIAIMLTVLAFNLLGDGLRDALDPRQRD
jgi:peptide/nickel transport system permease protein